MTKMSTFAQMARLQCSGKTFLDNIYTCIFIMMGHYRSTRIKKQEAHGPRFAHLSDIATADMQMFPIIYAKIQP